MIFNFNPFEVSYFTYALIAFILGYFINDIVILVISGLILTYVLYYIFSFPLEGIYILFAMALVERTLFFILVMLGTAYRKDLVRFLGALKSKTLRQNPQ